MSLRGKAAKTPEPKGKLDTMNGIPDAVASAPGPVNGPEDGFPEWDQVDWGQAEENVRRLRQRIFAASRAEDLKKVHTTASGKSAKRVWALDADLQSAFDSVPWDLVVKAVQAKVTHEQRWIVLYVKRWLAAPIVMPDGGKQARDKGTPRGSAV